jgi:hypothetical protein
MIFRFRSLAGWGVVIGVTLTLTLGMGSAAHAITFNAFNDFSTTLNPNGVWSYGQTPTLGGSFTLLHAGSCGPLTGWNNSGTADPSGSPPFIFKGTGTCGTGTPPAGQLDLHPGSGGQFADVRWTSPSAGSLDVTALFEGIDPTAGGTDVHLLLNGVPLLNGPITDFLQVTTFVETGVVVAAGSRLDFVVGFGSDNSFAFDSTGFNANISFQPSVGVPDSGSLVLLGSGLLGLAGFTWRRHRRK